MCFGGQRLFPVGHVHKHMGVVHVCLSERISRPASRKAWTGLSRWGENDTTCTKFFFKHNRLWTLALTLGLTADDTTFTPPTSSARGPGWDHRRSAAATDVTTAAPGSSAASLFSEAASTAASGFPQPSTATSMPSTAPNTAPAVPAGAISVQCRGPAITVLVARDFLLSACIGENSLYLGLPECGVNGGSSTHVQLTVGWTECDTRLVHVSLALASWSSLGLKDVFF